MDVDLVLSGASVVYGAITDNWPTIEPYFNETGSNCPSILPRDHQAGLMELAVQSVNALGLSCVPPPPPPPPPAGREARRAYGCAAEAWLASLQVATSACWSHGLADTPWFSGTGIFTWRVLWWWPVSNGMLLRAFEGLICCTPSVYPKSILDEPMTRADAGLIAFSRVQLPRVPCCPGALYQWRDLQRLAVARSFLVQCTCCHVEVARARGP